MPHQNPLQLDREGRKEKEHGERSGGHYPRDHFIYFCQRGTISRGAAIIQGNTVSDLSYLNLKFYGSVI